MLEFPLSFEEVILKMYVLPAGRCCTGKWKSSSLPTNLPPLGTGTVLSIWNCGCSLLMAYSKETLDRFSPPVCRYCQVTFITPCWERGAISHSISGTEVKVRMNEVIQ